MKLQSPNANDKLKDLLNKFGAKEKQFIFGEELKPRDDIGGQLDDGKEVDISSGLVNVEDDKTLSVQGRRVLVYIRDQYYQYFPCKFHVANCSKITEFMNSGRFEKFVASLRVDGYFKVNIVHSNNYVQEGNLEQLRVCKLCLQSLNYKGYNHNYGLRENIYNNFTLDMFFKEYGTTVNMPRHTDATSPTNTYRDNWPQISLAYRSKMDYTCESCGNDFSAFRSLLHVHHIDSRKDNNNHNNLKALCVKCHSKEHNWQIHIPKDYPY